jgi:hypothetical protein
MNVRTAAARRRGGPAFARRRVDQERLRQQLAEVDRINPRNQSRREHGQPPP